jgi:hypothetical protein
MSIDFRRKLKRIKIVYYVLLFLIALVIQIHATDSPGTNGVPQTATLATGNNWQVKIKELSSWVFVGGAALLSIATLGAIAIMGIRRKEYYRISIKHFPTVIGLPMAAITSLFIVLVCDVIAGDKIKFKVWGLEFEGGSGQVILWVVVFLAIATAIKLLWEKKYTSGN